MVDVIALGLSFLVRRFGVPVRLYFSHRAGSENIGIQCQLPEFSVTFLKGCLLEITPFLLRVFAPSREPFATSRRAARPDLFYAKAPFDCLAGAQDKLRLWRRREEDRSIRKVT
jgi:hypothetical protein